MATVTSDLIMAGNLLESLAILSGRTLASFMLFKLSTTALAYSSTPFFSDKIILRFLSYCICVCMCMCVWLLCCIVLYCIVLYCVVLFVLTEKKGFFFCFLFFDFFFCSNIFVFLINWLIYYLFIVIHKNKNKNKNTLHE